jgi:hypothetical protein
MSDQVVFLIHTRMNPICYRTLAWYEVNVASGRTQADSALSIGLPVFLENLSQGSFYEWRKFPAVDRGQR